MKELLEVRRTDLQHWVGDGFPVRSLFTYREPNDRFSPFLLLDYAGPYEFEPVRRRRGVGQHPHRGFETVTIVYDGEVEHGDSAGNSGTIGPGDVQWMTAASGVVHEEFHSADFSARGGRFEMVQLWVNLPARSKMSPPRYQGILAAQIPSVTLGGDAGTARVIAGNFAGASGPARTVTPLAVVDLHLTGGRSAELVIPDGHNTLVVVLTGEVAAGGRAFGDATLAVFDRAGDRVMLECRRDTHALLLTGEPIDEPVVGHGPFVMNTIGEIETAMRDYESGRMGRVEPMR